MKPWRLMQSWTSLCVSIHTAFDTLVGRNADFDAEAVKNLFQGSLETQMPLLGMTDIVCEELRKRIGIDRAKGTYPAYILYPENLGRVHRKGVSHQRRCFRSDDGAVYPRLPEFHLGRERTCHRYLPALSGYRQESLPKSL